jgi:polyisoprenoid-binding protein YceI
MSKWILDATHSEVQFKVKHLVISNVTGSFNDFSGEIESSDDSFSELKTSFSAVVASIDTNQTQRDEHLKSDDFFAAAAFPHITFSSTEKLQKSGDAHTLNGTLSIRGVEKPIQLAVDFGGIAKDGYGQTKAGFEITGKISRKEFGITWSALTEAGGIMVGDEVKLMINVQFVKQA